MLALFFAALLPILGTQVTVQSALNTALDDFHDAASKADEARYFKHFAKNGVFIGTDATERWTVAEFREYAHPVFAKGKGWTYITLERHIDVAPDGKSAWFYERLDNKTYGEARGSGVFILEKGHWKLAQYVLSFPIPNETASDVLKIVKAHKTPKPTP